MANINNRPLTIVVDRPPARLHERLQSGDIESISIDPSMIAQQSQPDAQSTPHVVGGGCVDVADVAQHRGGAGAGRELAPPPPPSETSSSLCSAGNETVFEHHHHRGRAAATTMTTTGIETTCSSADIYKMRAMGQRGDRSPTVRNYHIFNCPYR